MQREGSFDRVTVAQMQRGSCSTRSAIQLSSRLHTTGVRQNVVNILSCARRAVLAPWWCGVCFVSAGSARTDAAVAAALEDTPTDKKLQEYRARLLHIVKASYGKYYNSSLQAHSWPRTR